MSRLIDAEPLERKGEECIENKWNSCVAPTSWAHAEKRFLCRVKDAPTVDAVPVSQLEEWQAENETLKRLINGEWVDTDNVQKALGIDFASGMKMFDFSRTAEWSPPPMNGQKITTKFRLRRKDGDERGS